MFLKIFLSHINSFAASFNVIYLTSSKLNAIDFCNLSDQDTNVFCTKNIYSVADFLIE